MADTVLPISLENDSFPANQIISTATLTVAGRLDPDILQAALTKLVGIWPKLGARIVRNAQGKVEFHIPQAFSETRQAFVFTVSHSTSTKMPGLPQRTCADPQPDMASCIHLFRSPILPKTTPEWIACADFPVLAIHITCFSDMTCIGFSHPHILADALGTGIILRAWCSVLAGRESEVPALIEEDPLKDFGKPYPSTKAGVKALRASMRGDYHLYGLWARLKFYPPIFVEMILHPKETVHTVFIPEKTVVRLREEAMREGEKDVWVSDNDIVSAILLKLNTMHYSKKDKKPFVFAFAANLRGQIHALPKDSSKAWLHNALTTFTVPAVPTCDLRNMSVSALARQARNAINSQRPVEQREKQVTMLKEMARRQCYGGYCPSNARSYYITSWLAGGWGQLDFSPAVLHETDDNSSSGGQKKEDERKISGEAGKVVFAGGSACVENVPSRRFWSIIMSKQEESAMGEGGYWCEMAARPEMWPRIRQCLEEL